ncbi:helix-turn-helix transcriptional regulator [Nonomuraea lactucae]|uniref:helix-turn-helix transcriptional regulator n=1 Tax=Nonomuraea lactucae TaxID=2249762 RepID=UPI0019643606|nr:helix-turn-helix domain-containing protein [Nonomuraea lactucae]
MTSDMSQPASPADAALDSLSVLGEGTRRQIFAFIRRAHRPVTREEAAAGVGISRKLAAFHLDKLVDAGLLRARYVAPTGLRKVGRQPKLYEPTDSPIQVSIPDRRHELLAGLLLQAVLTEGDNETAANAAVRTARQHGHELGGQDRARLRPGRLGAERGLTLCEHMLNQHGFEPTREALDQLRLRNCPFHPLAAQAPDLVCGMNHAFLTGYLQGLQATTVQAVLASRPGECCVQLQHAQPQAPPTAG